MRVAAPIALLSAAAAPLFGQEPESPEPPATARMEVVETLRADLGAVRHPSDGQGRAWIIEEESDDSVVAGSRGKWAIAYEAGDEGIAEGGVLFLQVSPFWGWSTPQTLSPSSPGYTEIRCAVPGVEWAAETVDQQLLAIRFTRRGLRAGERVVLVYGAGDAGAVADRFAERDSRFWIAVDGDGDGVRKVLEDSPGVDVIAGPPARLHLTLPTTAEPGDVVALRIAVLDASGNVGLRELGEVSFDLPEGLKLRGGLGLHDGCGAIDVEILEPGIYRVKASGFGVEGESNPMVARQGAERVLWADLQVHTAASDGTGALADVYRYAREVAGLDVVCITDHDHWGMQFLDQQPSVWEDMRAAADRYDEPGEFVALLGFEWTNWVYGHRHVVYGGSEGSLFSSIDPRYDTPQELWAALRGSDAMTIAHHSAGGPVAVDWTIEPDPVLEPCTEIVSVHGSSESEDSPNRIYQPVSGNFVRDALGRGYRFGFLGSTDGHDGHPGLAHLAGAGGGLAAILAEEATRESVFEALRARRVYATNGARILLRFSLAGEPMGSVIPATADGEGVEMVVRVVGTAPLASIELIHAGVVVDAADLSGRRVYYSRTTLPDLRSGEYVYVRVLQEDGGMAWSSPVYVE